MPSQSGHSKARWSPQRESSSWPSRRMGVAVSPRRKRGAKLAESLSPVGVARAELVKALRWMGWVRRYAGGWKADAEEEEDPPLSPCVPQPLH